MSVILISLLLFYGFNVVYSVVIVVGSPPANPHWVYVNTLTTPIHWLLVILTVIIALAPRLVVMLQANQSSLFLRLLDCMSIRRIIFMRNIFGFIRMTAHDHLFVTNILKIFIVFGIFPSVVWQNALSLLANLEI